MSYHFDSFIDTGTYVPLQQHPHFAAALTGMGRAMDRCALPGGGSAQIMSRVIWPTRRSLKLVSRGPFWPNPVTSEYQWDALLRLRAAGVHLINNDTIPGDVMQAAGYRQIMTPATIALLDLRNTQTDRIAAMSAKWRNAMRKAAHAGLTLDFRPFDAATHDWILTADAAQQKTRRYRALSGDLVLSYAARNPGQVSVVTASDGGSALAAMIFLQHGASATYHIGWTAAEGRACNAHNLCLSIAMDGLAARGVCSIDLGQIDTVNLPGLARFKLGSGARPQTLGGTWLRVPWLRPRPLA